MAQNPPGADRPRVGPSLIRLGLRLPYSDLSLTSKQGGPIALDDSQMLLALVLPYGLGPNEPRVFVVDDTGRLRVVQENAGTDVDSSSGNVANAAAVATLAGVAGKTTFITGFEVTASGSTAALVVLVTVAGILGGTKTYVFTFPAGAAVAAQPLLVEFARPIPASAQNQAITVTVPPGGAGNLNAAVTAHGFQI